MDERDPSFPRLAVLAPAPVAAFLVYLSESAVVLWRPRSPCTSCPERAAGGRRRADLECVPAVPPRSAIAALRQRFSHRDARVLGRRRRSARRSVLAGETRAA